MKGKNKVTDSGPTQQKSLIIVELKERDDIRATIDVSITPGNIIEKSSVAITKAMDTVKNMASRIIRSVRDIPLLERPHEIEVEFGLKLTTDANALIVNAGAEAHFVVKLKWVRAEVDTLESDSIE